MKISIEHHYEIPGQNMAVPNITSPCRALETTAIRIIFRRFYKQKEFWGFLSTTQHGMFFFFHFPTQQVRKHTNRVTLIEISFRCCFISFVRFRCFHKIAKTDH